MNVSKTNRHDVAFPSGHETVSTTHDLTFPTVQGTNLQRRDFLLPDDFEGTLNLVFVAFKQEQQILVDSWIPEAKALARGYPEVRFYELPTLARYNAAYRWFISQGMRSGILDPATRALTIVLHLDKATFCDTLGLPDEETIYVLLVEQGGRILWRTEGAYAPEKAALLRQAITQENTTPWTPTYS